MSEIESSREEFLGLLVRASDDDPVWGVVADWLWEHGDPESEFVRHQAALRQLDEGDPSRLFLMRYCPAGSFRMGSPVDEPERNPNEGPVQVELTSGF